MSDMKLNEALNHIGQFKNVFRAFEKLEEVLTTTRKAEARNTKLRLEGEQIAADNVRAQKELDDFNSKAAVEIQKREDALASSENTYDKKRTALKAEFTDFVNDLSKQKDGLQARYDEKDREFSQKLEKKKAESAIKVEAMKREITELQQSRDALRASKAQLEKELGI